MSLLVDLAGEQLERHREVLPGNPEELTPWQEWTVYKSQHAITRLCGPGRSIRYVDGREESLFGGRLFSTLTEVELRYPYMKRVCRRSRWSDADEIAMHEVEAAGLPFYQDGIPPSVPLARVDATAYYLQIMTKASTQVEYRPSTGSWAPIGNYWVDTGELCLHKPLYASMPTRGWRRRTVPIWKKGVREEVRSTYLYQPQAWRFLCDLTHAIAFEARAMGAVRGLVDENWFPVAVVASWQGYLEDRYDIISKLKCVLHPRCVCTLIWEPGMPWPLRHTARVRELPEAVRNRLAWGMTGAGPRDPCFSGSLVGSRLILA